MQVVIAGGGIGGLTVALACARHGNDVVVLERDSLDSAGGAGIQLSPNATRLLRALGLGPVLEPVVSEPRSLTVRSHRSGLTVAEVPLGAAARARFGAPYWHLDRSDLIAVLREAVAANPRIAFETNSRVTHAESFADNARVTLDDGTVVEGDLLVGADGIRSVVRDAVAPGYEPAFASMVGWRGLVRGESESERSATLWPGPGAHAVTYPAGSGGTVNVIAIVERDNWTNPSWRARGTRDALLADFRGWHSDLTGLLERIDVPYQWALYRLPPLPRWYAGRIVLVGDAAHAMLPFAAQGAAQAIEDAWVLSESLARGPQPDAALDQFERLRRERVERVRVESERRGGVYHRRSLMARLGTLLPGGGPALTDGFSGEAHAWLYGYDAAAAVDGMA